MKKESLFYTQLSSLERNTMRRTALWMFGLMAAGCLALVGLVPLWYGVFPPSFKVMLVVGAVVMAAAIPFHILAGSRKAKVHSRRTALYLPAILLNLVGMSVFEAAYYTRIQVNPPMTDLIAGAVLPIGFCLVCMLGILLASQVLRALSLIFGGVGLAGMVTCIVFWVKAGLTASSVLWSFALFNLMGVLIVLIAFNYAASELCDVGNPADSASDDGDVSSETSVNPQGDLAWSWLRFLSFASFGLFLIVAAVVLIILMCLGGDCDCGCGDCCDCGGGGGEKSSVKRRRRRG